MTGRQGELPVGIGDVVASRDGRYAVEAVIGEGGMGVVFGGRDIATGARVAIKVMRAELLSNPEAMSRFEREARAACSLRGEHVARVLDLGRTANGEPFMVMEYLFGASLYELIAKDKHLEPHDVVAYMVDVADALLEAHGLGIVHRDLKPENIFVVEKPDGSTMAKVLDFGIAKVDNALIGGTSLTTTGSMLGTPWFMAPEQLDTKRGVTPKTDIWALGATMYKALTGKTPFQADSFYELSVKVYAHEPTPITDYRPGLPRALVDLVHGCLQKDVNRRLSLEDLIERLEAVRTILQDEAPTGNGRNAAFAAPPDETQSAPVLRAANVTVTANVTVPTPQGMPTALLTPGTAVLPPEVVTRMSTPAFPVPSAPIALGGGTVSPYTTPYGGPSAPARSSGPWIAITLALAVMLSGLVGTVVLRGRTTETPTDLPAATPVPEPMPMPMPMPTETAALPSAVPAVIAPPPPLASTSMAPEPAPPVVQPTAQTRPPAAPSTAPVVRPPPPPVTVRKPAPPPPHPKPDPSKGGALTHER